MQNVEYCLDLRELIKLGDFAQAQKAIVEGLLQADSFANESRVYVGSSFCPQALMNSAPLMDAVFEVCRQQGRSVTLSVPIVAQRFLDEALQFLETTMQQGAGVIDELVLNDLGMLDWACERIFKAAEDDPFHGVKACIGRLLNKDTRDPRDPEYPYIPKAPNMLQPDFSWSTFLERMRATWSYWNEGEQEYICPIGGIELDPTHETLILDALPQDMSVALNGPLCYMSTGQICEYASIGLADEQAFRPNSTCANQCTHTSIHYTGENDVEFHKLGRTVYFKPPWQTALRGVSTYRQLVSPLEEVRG